MKTITDKAIADELITRLNALTADAKPQWGKMNAWQMLHHLALWEELAMEKIIYKQSFLGKLVGRFALKEIMKDGPMRREMPTAPGFAITGEGDFEAEKQKLVNLINEHTQYLDNGFMHPFFGQLSVEVAGHLAYKHADHHLGQFGV